MRFPILTGFRWLIMASGVICFVIGLVTIFGSLTADTAFHLSDNTSLFGNHILALVGSSFGLGCISTGVFLIAISEIIGLVMTAEHSLFRMANALETTKGYQVDRLINSSKAIVSIEDAGDALKKAFGSPAPYSGLAKENSEVKHTPKGISER